MSLDQIFVENRKIMREATNGHCLISSSPKHHGHLQPDIFLFWFFASFVFCVCPRLTEKEIMCVRFVKLSLKSEKKMDFTHFGTRASSRIAHTHTQQRCTQFIQRRAWIEIRLLWWWRRWWWRRNHGRTNTIRRRCDKTASAFVLH